MVAFAMMNKYEYKTMINNMAVYPYFLYKKMAEKGTSIRFTTPSVSNIKKIVRTF